MSDAFLGLPLLRSAGLEKPNYLSETSALLSFVCRGEHVCDFVSVIVQDYQHEFSAAQWARLSCWLGIGQELDPLLFLPSVFLAVKPVPVIGPGGCAGSPILYSVPSVQPTDEGSETVSSRMLFPWD